MKRKPPLLDKPYTRQRPLLEEEKALWHAEFASSKHKKPAQENSVAATQATVKKEKNIPSVPSTAVSPISSFDKRTIAKIRNQSSPIEATLDLHGHTQETAYVALVQFIERLQGRGIRLALVITGKGRGKEEGTLRQMLPRWLSEAPLRQYIIAYDTASLRHGGNGAWYVRIRKKLLKNA